MGFIQFFKMFFSEPINWAFIVAFFATFGLYKCHFAKPLDARYKEIETYLDILKKYNPQNVNVYFESLSQEMENSDLIKGIWRKYQRTLISIPGKDGLEKYSTVESESYFSVAAFTEGMKSGLWSGVSGDFYRYRHFRYFYRADYWSGRCRYQQYWRAFFQYQWSSWRDEYCVCDIYFRYCERYYIWRVA